MLFIKIEDRVRLKKLGKQLAFLINFNVPLIKKGIKRIIL
jgi:hypothetical protein